MIKLFDKGMTENQRAGIAVLHSAMDDARLTDDRQRAYVLATVYHETGRLMQPVREGFCHDDAASRRCVMGRSYGKPDPSTGHVYYGRGLIQITWGGNYRRVGDAIGVNLYADPDEALKPLIAARIAAQGMRDGLFSGVRLDQFFNDERDDPIAARRIINGQDRADLIASYHAAFLSDLTGGQS